MSASQTLHLIEKLTEANIPKETAAELLEFVEQAQKGTVSKDYIDARFEGLEASVNARFETLEARFEGLEASVNARFEGLEASVNARFEGLEASVNARFEGLEASVKAQFTGLRLFVAFNTALLIAVLVKLFVG